MNILGRGDSRCHSPEVAVSTGLTDTGTWGRQDFILRERSKHTTKRYELCFPSKISYLDSIIFQPSDFIPMFFYSKMFLSP